MKIDCTGCLHGHYPELDGGDLLILCGDYTAADKTVQWALFFEWIKKQDYTKKILIGGNHDNFMMNGLPKSAEEAKDLQDVQSMLTDEEREGISDFEYLCDSGTEFEGLKIWGSPWTSRFVGINPKCCAFTGENDKEIAPHFKKIPTDTDILITHGPPEGIMDMTTKGEHVGSPSLMKEHLTRIRPKLWVFSHIHEGYGQIGTPDRSETVYVNCSHMDEKYRAVNPPIRIEL